MANNNQLRKKVIDAIVKAASSTIENSGGMSWKQLQAKAVDFLFNYEALEKQQDLFSGALLKLAFKEENLDINKIEKAVLEDKKVKSDLAKAKFLLAFQFNDYLDMYRRRTQERIGLYVKETYNEGTGEYDLDSYEIPLIDLEFLTSYIAGGIMNVLFDWINDGLATNPNVVCEKISYCSNNLIRGTLENLKNSQTN